MRAATLLKRRRGGGGGRGNCFILLIIKLGRHTASRGESGMRRGGTGRAGTRGRPGGAMTICPLDAGPVGVGTSLVSTLNEPSSKLLWNFLFFRKDSHEVGEKIECRQPRSGVLFRFDCFVLNGSNNFSIHIFM